MPLTEFDVTDSTVISIDVSSDIVFVLVSIAEIEIFKKFNESNSSDILNQKGSTQFPVIFLFPFTIFRIENTITSCLGKVILATDCCAALLNPIKVKQFVQSKSPVFFFFFF